MGALLVKILQALVGELGTPAVDDAIASLAPGGLRDLIREGAPLAAHMLKPFVDNLGHENVASAYAALTQTDAAAVDAAADVAEDAKFPRGGQGTPTGTP